ncbi:DMT family transporter [Novosphingobium sp. SL115]|uniref:DMT family transporter n=1 Tax=Novosphingobium sp. SL115 TaxID=2995150 RepID=UPI0022724BC5|nr:DMT family transporter [Novosphingobium sp. SL115]MCY1671792.1 DMT family transporter [Novosphingobium sp. SL115]
MLHRLVLIGKSLQDSHKSALLLALTGFALLSVGDALVKGMAGLWPGTAIGALRYLFGAIGLGVALLLREGLAGFTFGKLPWQILRGFSVALSAVTFFTAVHLMSMGEATAIGFTSPMITALLAAILLKEPLRRTTWIASGVAFAGVLLILRPNFALLGPAALLPMASATGMALLIIANRKVAGTGSALSMQFNVAFIGTIFLLVTAFAGHFSGLAFFAIPVPPPSVIARCAIIAVSASTAHALIYMATTRAGASTIAPMTYVQLLMAGGFGWALFDERPDAMAALGAVVIVGAGLYLWRAGRAPATTDGNATTPT